MSEPISFTVPGPPQPKERARKGKGGRWYTPVRTKQFEAAVKARATVVAHRNPTLRSLRTTGGARYILTVRAYFGDARRRDADNVGKAVADALNGIFYLDDSQIASLTVQREIDRENPRTEIVIEVAS